MVKIFVVVLIILILIAGFKIVPESQEWIVERLGKYHKTLKSGVNFILPIFDSVVNRVFFKRACP